jgi:hypothetical protein
MLSGETVDGRRSALTGEVSGTHSDIRALRRMGSRSLAVRAQFNGATDLRSVVDGRANLESPRPMAFQGTASPQFTGEKDGRAKKNMDKSGQNR